MNTREQPFYSHLIDLKDLEDLLQKYPLTDDEKAELLQTVKHTIHLEITKFVLDNLPEAHHEVFIYYQEYKPEDKGVLVYLKRSIDDLDGKLANVIHFVKKDFINILHDYKDASEEWLEADLK